MTARLLTSGAVLTGRLSSYTIVKELDKAADDGAAEMQSLRPLVDEIRSPADRPAIVLRYLDSDLLTESNKKRLSRPEIKHVARCVREALRVLHRDGMVHTDIKLDNIFINRGRGAQRLFEVQLGDCGGVVSHASPFARNGHVIGAAFTRSPEATLQLPWTTATDVWSFGTALLSLLLGGGYHLFNPAIEGVSPDSDAPYPASYSTFNDPDTTTIIDFINSQDPPAKPFACAGPGEIPPADREFVLKVMKLDPRDRPTTEELLGDGWFGEESLDTRAPLPGGGAQPGEAEKRGEGGPGSKGAPHPMVHG
ncbi:kinase-like domain-containing protein [Staphylotrichum tortipilum]|uniref:Kinase-like domain-containing protein n=1 Tax=Staphylotrichum tortipilum TaxID=2831512 RepID=A0AAN6MH68_9PEZI|nr:kinase-like domain-containing protein [Staphylotrichum longicolle]